MRMLDEKSDNDVEVTWEDQQRINKFSRLHAIYSDLEDEIKARRTEREDLEDLSLELELREDEMILYKIGDAYVSMTQSEAMAQLETDTQRAEQELTHLQDRMDECEKGMKELKVLLYARFGNNINLER
ncbi:Similar to S.cerevisiae protein GIM3 (Subunit of the heterohexameric cochaperone prefoldin complex) [Malassezia sympodialis ATCC 42132]|uniref:Prefoldin subunit 4 n=1 Tax=Malassezia sympodialis (strain ATCC 42132) TaxID=1230383 RepID=A0A1M8A9C2_MALS4|nr:Similar to S.cerevisiae protein GIM3 (Subunit of the heterohexameric cochaperone prefoldin complex) [Malassezia sympodialis ATCC 42132]